MLYQNVEYKPTYRLLPPGSCLDHYSVIQNFSKNWILKSYIPAGDISHKRQKSRQARGLIQERKTIEDYDDINNVIAKFREWRESYELYPKFLHGHGINNKGEPVEATWRLATRFHTNRNIAPLSQALHNYIGKGVFLTLTVEHSITLRNAWENIAKMWNTFLTRLSIEMGIMRKELHYVWVLEAQRNGYPHIHALFLGVDWLFWAGNKKEWNSDNPHSKNLKHFWKYGSIYVNATRRGENVRNPIDYMMKYIRKTFSTNEDEDGKKELTQALLWAFNKRSFNTSRGLFEYLNYKKPMRKGNVTLHGMANYEILTGQKTFLLRIETKQSTNVEYEKQNEILRILTIDDIPELEQLASEMRATNQELKALRWLTWAKAKGKDWVFPMTQYL